jgi:hypothetical protein
MSADISNSEYVNYHLYPKNWQEVCADIFFHGNTTIDAHKERENNNNKYMLS